MQKNLTRIIEEKIKLEKEIESILYDAAFCERFIAKPNNNRCPTMYKLLETYYDKADWGFHEKPKLKLRASPRQMTRYDLAIDLLLEITDEVFENPIEARKLLWLRANRFAWTKLGKMFGYHRVRIKQRYETILERLANKIRINIDKYDRLFS